MSVHVCIFKFSPVEIIGILKIYLGIFNTIISNVFISVNSRVCQKTPLSMEIMIKKSPDLENMYTSKMFTT